MSQKPVEHFATAKELMNAVAVIMPEERGVYLPCNLIVSGADSILLLEERVFSFVSRECVSRWLNKYKYIFELAGVSLSIDIPASSKG